MAAAVIRCHGSRERDLLRVALRHGFVIRNNLVDELALFTRRQR